MKKTLYILDDTITKELENKIINQKNLVLVLDIHLKKNLESIGIQTLDEEKFLNFNDYEEIDQKTLDFSRNWFMKNELESILTYNNINIGFTLQHEIYFYVLKYLHRIKLIQKVIQEIKPDKILTIFSEDVLGKIPYSVSISNNIETKILSNTINLSKKNRFEQVNFPIRIFGKNIDITVSKKQFRFIKKNFEKYWDLKLKLSNKQKNKSKHKEKSILFLDFNLIWHESFLKLLEKKYNLFFLNNRRPIIWNKDSFKIAKELTFSKVNLPKIQNEIKDEQQEFAEKFKNIMKTIELEKFFKFNNFNFYGIFKNELEKTVIDRSKDIIELIKKTEKFLEYEKIDVVWTLDDWGYDRTIVQVCQQQKIPICNFLSGSIAVQKPDGRRWISPAIAGERIADKLLIWGENDKKNCLEANVDPKKIVIGGAPRYEELFGKEKNEEDYILILTGGFPSTQNSYFLSTSLILNFEKRLEKVLKEIKKFNKKIIIKRHPTQGPQEIIDLQKMFAKILPDAVVLKDANTIDLISNASLIISMQSTVVEESIILDKPIILLPYLKNDNGIPYVSSGAVIEINESDDAFRIIEKCLFDESTKEKLRLGRQKFVENAFSFQKTASEHHITIMEDLLERKQDQ